VHADLIVGLPGEDLESFGRGFDRLVRLGPQEIQVGMLKRLRGTPIVRHDAEWGMVYSPAPPYEVLHTRLIDFAAMQRLRRFARYWDLIANSGNFVEATSLLWSILQLRCGVAQHPRCGAAHLPDPSPFRSFLALSDWLHARVGQSHGIALSSLFELFFTYLTDEIGHDRGTTAQTLWRDYQRGGRNDRPTFLKPYVPDAPAKSAVSVRVPRRQARHLATIKEAPRP
jgi:hypothetical protein